jgi:hypothetical protein
VVPYHAGLDAKQERNTRYVLMEDVEVVVAIVWNGN